MLEMKLDISGLKQKLDALKRGVPGASGAALKQVMQAAMREIITDCPRDTQRMVRGFSMAANQAGLGPYPIPLVMESRKFAANQRALKKQLKYYRFRMGQYQRKNRMNQPYYWKLVRWAQRSEEELNKLTGGSIVIRNKGRNVALTVRYKVYGGRGEYIRTGGASGTSYYKITNMEPHAIIRERRWRGVARTMAKYKVVGVTKMKRAFLDELKKVAPSVVRL